MPRVRPKKTNRGEIPSATYEAACKRIVENKETIRSVAKSFNICHVTLRRYFIKFTNGESINAGYHPYNKVFTGEHEQLLAEYCKTVAQLYYGLTTNDLRKLAYQFAFANDFKYPKSWNKNKLAGMDWFKGFIKRNPSIRVPDETSLPPAINLSKANATKFYEILATMSDTFTPEKHWNLSEKATSSQSQT